MHLSIYPSIYAYVNVYFHTLVTCMHTLLPAHSTHANVYINMQATICMHTNMHMLITYIHANTCGQMILYCKVMQFHVPTVTKDAFIFEVNGTF